MDVGSELDCVRMCGACVVEGVGGFEWGRGSMRVCIHGCAHARTCVLVCAQAHACMWSCVSPNNHLHANVGPVRGTCKHSYVPAFNCRPAPCPLKRAAELDHAAQASPSMGLIQLHDHMRLNIMSVMQGSPTWIRGR